MSCDHCNGTYHYTCPGCGKDVCGYSSWRVGNYQYHRSCMIKTPAGRARLREIYLQCEIDALARMARRTAGEKIRVFWLEKPVPLMNRHNLMKEAV